jgi:hemoglobin
MPIPERRSELVTDMMARTGINAALIERLVHSFYKRVREDDLLGPIFDARVKSWDAHLARMCLFWSSVALGAATYEGSPMQVHAPLPVDAHHFDRWLELFEETANEVCPPAAAEHFGVRARRISQSLELGIAVHNGHIPRKGERYHRRTRDSTTAAASATD